MKLSSSRAGFISLAANTLILTCKFFAYEMTGSQAILSDALEGIINIVAAGTAFFVLSVSNRPADRNHPYGHGKAEYFSAAFEGGLISFAAALIVISAGHALVSGHTVSQLDSGLLLVAVAAGLNLVLALYLMRAGKTMQSSALIASGHHSLSDFWTTLATIAGLGLAQLTGLTVIDPIVALGMGALLTWTGVKIVRGSLGALLDEEDEEMLESLADACNRVRLSGIIKVHHVRAMRSGSYHFIDAHVVVPEFWEVHTAHDEVNRFERKLIEAHSHRGEIHFHTDPCRRQHCGQCDLADCPIRQAPFGGLATYTIEGITAKKAS
ncbi:MAG: cation transporter [Proteobacteria bacterium]|nr:cation transporter [Pseudomonadota bacterium]